MYDDRYNWCDCDRADGIEDIKKGICKIQEGIKDIQCGLKLLCKCKVREGVKEIKKGLCKIEKGLCYCMRGLQDIDDCTPGKKSIKDGICAVKDGIKCIEKGLCDICKCGICKGIDDIRKGLDCVEKGLCSIVEGLKDVMKDRDIKRKPKCDVMGEMDYGDCMCNDRMSYGGCWDDKEACDRRGAIYPYDRPDCYKW